jgi:DNA-binding CsgD family transcriptional regulator
LVVAIFISSTSGFLYLYVMLRFFISLIFILSVALSAGGVILSSRLRNRYKSDIFSTLLYFQVFTFTFGFYGIWGQVVIRSFLSAYFSTGLIARFSDIAVLLGMPFLFFAWLMLIQFSLGISGRKSNSWFIFWFLFLNFSLLFFIGYLIAKSDAVKPILLIRNYYIIMNLIYTLAASLIVRYPWKGKSFIHDHDRRIIAPVLFLITTAQCLILVFYSSQPYIGMIFTFLFFAGNTYLPLYMSYGTFLPSLTAEPLKDLSFEELCRKFEVSPRETDIVREICNGLSNKEISEKLFISLQTVKDHTHRIYIKTNVKSRVQLINLVKKVIVK